MTHPEIACAEHRLTAKEIMGNSYEFAAIEMAMRYLLPGADVKSVCYTNLAACEVLTQIPYDLKDRATKDINEWILLHVGIWSVTGYIVGQFMIYISEWVKKNDRKK